MKVLTIIIGLAILLGACKKEENEKTGFNLFSVNDDIKLGQQLKAEIESNPAEYPILDEATHGEAYEHIYRVRDAILATGDVGYDEEFAYEVYIINDDNVVNAFACPGGYLYFYTGLIKFLDNEAQFAGVMGHEMAHVARRHSTETLTKVYGISMLFDIVLGKDAAKLAEIAAQMATGAAALAFSRDHEYEADQYAVQYLYKTDYHAPALGDFFEKLETSSHPPEFLSTHPSPENRLEEINRIWTELGGANGEFYESSYTEFKNSLP